MAKTVMIIGAGAREHAISDAYERSNDVSRIIVAPGNGLIPWNRQKEVLIDPSCKLKDASSFLALAKKYKPDVVDVAQDDALAAGTVDLLKEHGFTVFGPSRAAARIEWDKAWSRDVMLECMIPHPNYHIFDSPVEAKNFLGTLNDLSPISDRHCFYVKASGLCQGKGALRVSSLKDALSAVDKMASFGDAGKVFLIEAALTGSEFSSYAICDGEHAIFLGSAQDHKRALNFDVGEQTGGMGAISPVSITEGKQPELDEIIEKACAGMKQRGAPYTGILYLGGISNGSPSVIEFNARWGDPECQVVLPGFEGDYCALVQSALAGKLHEVSPKFDTKVRICVVGASRGYPGDYSVAMGLRIVGLEDAAKVPGVKVLGAGIREEDGKFYANGGRLFNIVAEADSLQEARARAYDAMSRVYIPGNNLHFRTDIGWRELERKSPLVRA